MLRLHRPIAAILTAFILACPAFADIKAYNAAVKAGDYKTAAAEAETIWKTWNMADEQTAIIAREFGYASLVAGRYELAKQFGQFLAEKGATLSKPDDQPLTSAVLLRIADFGLVSGAEPQRGALREALLARNAAPGTDMTSVLSWQALYAAAWNKGDWTAVTADVGAAAEFMKRQPALIARQREAEVLAAAASFIQNRAKRTSSRNEAYDVMADVHDAISGDINTATNAGIRTQLWRSKWQAEAWAAAIESYLDASYAQIGSNISTSLKPRPLVQPASSQFPPVASPLPRCEGDFEGRKLTYPESKAYSGLVGSVIVNIQVSEDGKVTKADILAAIPSDEFGNRVVDTVRTWTYKPARGMKPGQTCRLNTNAHVYKVNFTIG
ncbi:MAG: TonB family protein [Hyphomicrobiaceae bacterium]